jgi:MFS family permease
MTSLSSSASDRPFESTFAVLGPIVLAVFLEFLAVGVPLAALSLEMRDHLGSSSVTIGWAIGLQSLATLLTRHQAGTLCDERGPRFAVLVGLPLAATSGLVYALSSVLSSVRLRCRLRSCAFDRRRFARSGGCVTGRGGLTGLRGCWATAFVVRSRAEH